VICFFFCFTTWSESCLHRKVNTDPDCRRRRRAEPYEDRPGRNARLLFGSLSHMSFGTILLVRSIPGSPTRGCARVKDRIAFGSASATPRAPCPWLRAAACKSRTPRGRDRHLPVAFKQGNDAAWRARDHRRQRLQRPKHWAGALVETVERAALLGYARSQPELDESAAERAHDEIARLGHEIVHQVRFREVRKGFRTVGRTFGLSMASRSDHSPGWPPTPPPPPTHPLATTSRQTAHQAVQPGEFILRLSR